MTVSSSTQRHPTLAALGRGDPDFATDCDWLTAQLTALYLHDERGRITSRCDAGRTPAPRFHLGRTRHGVLWRLRRDLPAPLAARLSRLAARDHTPTGDTLLWPSPERNEDLRRALDGAEPVVSVFRGLVFRLPEDAESLAVLEARGRGAEPLDPASPEVREALCGLLPAVFPDAAEVSARAPLVASRDEQGQLAAVCCVSSGDPARAVEAGVETLPTLRRLGHGSRAVAAWLAAVRRLGGTPLYATSSENRASLGLARSLGLEAFADIVHWS